MAAFKVVCVNICCNRLSGLFDIVPFRQISFVIFEGTEPSLDHDIVGPAAFAIHALTDVVFLKKIFVFMAGKLATLIRVKNYRLCYFKGFFAGVNAGSCIKRVVQFPSDDASAVPIDDSGQIQESSLDWNIRVSIDQA